MKKFVFSVAILLFAIGARPLPGADVALLDSSNTRDFYFSSGRYGLTRCSQPDFLGPDEYERYFLGWQYVLQGQPHNAFIGQPTSPFPAGFSFEVIEDGDITASGLADHTVLILSNNASLSDKQHRAIQKWVTEGGRLIATFGSGYKDIISDGRQDDNLKLQSGGTGGIHQLWHDPWTKAFGTQSITPDDPLLPGVDVGVTKIFGPTAVPGDPDAEPPTGPWGAGKILSYGAEANLLVPRPEHFRNALAFLLFSPADDVKRPQPAILHVPMGKGLVVYFAFAPEFIVSLAFDLAGHCDGDGNYPPYGACVLCGNPAVGPQAADFPNAFVGPIVPAPPPVNTDRVGPMLQLMKQTIQYMLNP